MGGGEQRDIVVPKTSGYKTVDTNCPMNDPPAVLSGVKNKTIREVISFFIFSCFLLRFVQHIVDAYIILIKNLKNYCIV